MRVTIYKLGALSQDNDREATLREHNEAHGNREVELVEIRPSRIVAEPLCAFKVVDTFDTTNLRPEVGAFVR